MSSKIRLYDNDDVDLITVYLLYQVQKGKKPKKEALAHLRKYHLVEGRVGNLYISAPLAKSDDEKAEYIKKKGFDNQYYQDISQRFNSSKVDRTGARRVFYCGREVQLGIIHHFCYLRWKMLMMQKNKDSKSCPPPKKNEENR